MAATSIAQLDVAALDSAYRSLGLEATYQIEALVQVLLREAAAFGSATGDDNSFDTTVKSIALRIDALNHAAMSILDADGTDETFREVTGMRVEIAAQKVSRAGTADART